MGLLKWLFKHSYETEFHEVSLAELGEAAAEVQMRRLAMAACINMTGNALALSVFRTYAGGDEVQGEDFYTLNVRPNPNQSAAEFWRAVVAEMMMHGEALVISQKTAGREALWLADGFAPVDDANPFAANRWQVTSVGGKSLNRVFAEKDVLHFKPGAMDVRAPLAALCGSYARLMDSVQKDMRWRLGKHYKAKIDRMAQGTEDFNEKFRQMLEKQIKPALTNDITVLPQFEGYEYSDLATEKTGKGTMSDLGREYRNLCNDILEMTAIAYAMPPVLLLGKVADSKDAFARWMTEAIDPLAETIADEINHKSFGAGAYLAGKKLVVDTSGIQHFDIFSNADHIAKLVGSGWSYNDILRIIGGAEVDEDWANQHFFTKNNEAVSALKGGEKE